MTETCRGETRFPWVVALSALVGLAGCGDGACPDVSVCDIRQLDCQEDILRAVSCMRESDATRPALSVISEQQLLERLGEGDESDEQEERSYRQWTHALSLYELAPREYDRDDAWQDYASNVSAVYFNDTKDIVIIDRGESLATTQAVEILAHELTHAMQDAEHDLTAWKRKWMTDYDSALAARSVIEGEAVLYQLLVSLQFEGLSARDADWKRYFDRWRRKVLEEADLDQAPVEMADLRVPYAFGGGLVVQHWLARGRAGVDALWSEPPLTTQELLFGPSEPATSAGRAALVEHGVPVLSGSFFEQVEATSLGAWITRMFAARMGVNVFDRLSAARAQLHDVFSVQVEAGTGNLVAAWRVRMQESASPTLWPGLSSPRLTTWVEPLAAEVFMLGADQPLNDPRSLVWQAPAAPAADDQAQTASARGNPPWLRPKHSSGCSIERPAFHRSEDVRGQE